jgi:hypothetical protein
MCGGGNAIASSSVSFPQSTHFGNHYLFIGLIVIAGLWSGLQNSLAGGGSFVTLPVLILSGLSPLAINLTLTVALFPGQVTSGLAGRKLVTGEGRLPFWGPFFFSVSILGGAFGGLLLLKTPSSAFPTTGPLARVVCHFGILLW